MQSHNNIQQCLPKALGTLLYFCSVIHIIQFEFPIETAAIPSIGIILALEMYNKLEWHASLGYTAIFFQWKGVKDYKCKGKNGASVPGILAGFEVNPYISMI